MSRNVDAPKYRAVLFDLDDTLFDHQAHRREALAAVGETIPFLAGVPLTQLEVRHEAHLQRTHKAVLSGQLTLSVARLERMRGVLRDFNIQPIAATVEACERAYRAAYDREWRAVPGALELVRSLRQLGVWVGVITNGLLSEQDEKLRVIGLDTLVNELVVSETVGATKPSRRFFEYALARAGASPGECVVVGDLWDVDIKGAIDMGIDAIWLNRYAQSRPPSPNVTELTSLLPTHDVLQLLARGPSV